MSAFKANVIGIGIVALLSALIIGGIWLEISVWQECRTDHSWFYCLRLMGGK